MFGIDVSYHNQSVDWATAKNQGGVEFAILRAGYGREVSQKDQKFEVYYTAARAAGLPVGAYWYSYADSVEDARREADACLACLAGKQFQFPVYFDIEDSTQAGFGKQTITQMCVAFCTKIQQAGYQTGVYANTDWWTNRIDGAQLPADWSRWLADYRANYNTTLPRDIHQYTSSGSVPGIAGQVDLNNSSRDYTADAGGHPTPQPSNVSAIYRVRAQAHGWLPEVTDLSDYAGYQNDPVTDIAIRVTAGSVNYRVHVKGGGWLPYVTGYDTNDHNNGYAGNGKPIDAVEVYYSTPDNIRPYKRAKYRAAPVGGSYYSWQYDSETGGGQDGYAGAFGKAIDKFQMCVE